MISGKPETLQFTKMHGIGNDFIVVEDLACLLPDAILPQLAKRVNDRRFGVGGDGLILLRPSAECDYTMRMINPDGSESEMCGNGIRCLAKLAFETGFCSKPSVVVETGAGHLPLALNVSDGIVTSVRVDMGKPRWLRGQIPAEGPANETFLRQEVGQFEVSAVSMGNPHAVVFVPDASLVPLDQWGPQLANDPAFPARINAHFVQVLSPREIVQRTWERGAGATLACGTGASGCVAIGSRLRLLDPHVTVHLPGGDLDIELDESGTVHMTGPAEAVFTGRLSASLLRDLA